MKFKKRSDGADVSTGEKPEEETPKNPRKTEISVIIYTLIIFVAAVGLILLSYAVQQRATGTVPASPGLYGALDAEETETYNENLKGGGTEP